MGAVVIDDAVQPMLVAARSFAIITSPLCRAAVGRLLRSQFSDVAVLSFLEIPDGKGVEVVAVVGGEQRPTPRHDPAPRHEQARERVA